MVSFVHLSYPALILETWFDDLYAAVESDLTQNLQDNLNSNEPSIQFTVQRETNREIAFIKVSVCWQDNGQLASKGLSQVHRPG